MKTLREVIKDETLALLLAGVTSRQDRACILLALGCGLRLGELAALNVESFIELPDAARNEFPHTAGFVRVEQTHSFSHFPIGPAALTAVHEHLEMRNTTRGYVPLFVAPSGGRLTTGQLAKLLLHLCTRLGLPPFSYHSLRHTSIGHYVAGGLNLVAFKQLMEYASDSVSSSRLQAVRGATRSW